jgi:hypothetical protein
MGEPPFIAGAAQVIVVRKFMNPIIVVVFVGFCGGDGAV